jgi:hypothetical protein
MAALFSTAAKQLSSLVAALRETSDIAAVGKGDRFFETVQIAAPIALGTLGLASLMVVSLAPNKSNPAAVLAAFREGKVVHCKTDQTVVTYPATVPLFGGQSARLGQIVPRVPSPELRRDVADGKCAVGS